MQQAATSTLVCPLSNDALMDEVRAGNLTMDAYKQKLRTAPADREAYAKYLPMAQDGTNAEFSIGDDGSIQFTPNGDHQASPFITRNVVSLGTRLEIDDGDSVAFTYNGERTVGVVTQTTGASDVEIRIPGRYMAVWVKRRDLIEKMEHAPAPSPEVWCPPTGFVRCPECGGGGKGVKCGRCDNAGLVESPPPACVSTPLASAGAPEPVAAEELKTMEPPQRARVAVVEPTPGPRWDAAAAVSPPATRGGRGTAAPQ